MNTLQNLNSNLLVPSKTSEEENLSGIKLIACVVREEQLNEVIEAICRIFPVGGINLMDVRSYDPRSQKTAQYRGISYPVTISRRIRLEVGVPAEQVSEIVQAIREAARTGRPGDGKIFVTDVSNVERIRTGERGLAAL